MLAGEFVKAVRGKSKYGKAYASRGEAVWLELSCQLSA